jgi:hypothetical protein
MYNFDVKNRLTVFSVKYIAKENQGPVHLDNTVYGTNTWRNGTGYL